MEYFGPIYGQVGKKFVQLKLHSFDVDQMADSLAIIAADAASVSDDWLKTQPDGIRRIIENIRKHATTP